jgi:hypothetical protein
MLSFQSAFAVVFLLLSDAILSVNLLIEMININDTTANEMN